MIAEDSFMTKQWIKMIRRLYEYRYLTLAIVGVFVLLGVVAWLGRSSMNVSASDNTVNLLKSGWNYMPGVSPQSDGLHVSYIGRGIVKQDGTFRQANSAINTYGTYLSTPGDFAIHGTLANINGGATIRLYDSVPIVQDEFRSETRGLELKITKNDIRVAAWGDATKRAPEKQSPVETHTYTLASSSTVSLSIMRSGDKMTVSANGNNLVTLATRNLVRDRVWLGLSAERPGDSWVLSRLEADGLKDSVANNAQTASPYTKSSSGIQALATAKRPGFLVGVAATFGPAVSDTDYARTLFGGDFGQLTPENALKWQFIHPQPDVYNFSEADALVDLARKNKLSVHGHTLVFGEANPAWVRALPIVTASDKERVKQTMIDHIRQTVGHFKGKIASWDVVNEPLADYDTDAGTSGLRKHLWYEALGESYIAAAFKAAHEADPQAKLYINEFGLEDDDERWQVFLALVSRLKSQGVPIDGVGFQSHVYEPGDEIDRATLRGRIQTLAKLGLTSRISEMDVHRENGSTAQAKQYTAIFDVCLTEPSCVSWSTWGVSDRYNMSLDDDGSINQGQDFLWDTRMQPTQALRSLRDMLSS